MRLPNLVFLLSPFPVLLVKITRGLFPFPLLLVILSIPSGLHAQSSERVFLTEELQNIEKTLKAPELSAAARHTMLIQQARLFLLAGNLEGAAQAWMDAAFAEQGKRDDGALLEGAFCLFAMGELEKAEAQVKTIALTGKDRGLLSKARYLDAQIRAFQSEDTAALIELIPDPDYDRYRPAIYYTLWKISRGDVYKTRLLSEYPLSPESRIVKDSSTGSIRGSPSAMWLLFPGRGRGSGEEAPDTLIASLDKLPKALQTGLFSREENARAMADRLKTAGFEAAVNQRAITDGGTYWVVTVPLGTDINRTMVLLKNKGFDSFPVF